MPDVRKPLSQDDLDGLLSLARDYAIATPDGYSHTKHAAISKLLRRVREAFRMDVVFVSEFTGGMRVFKHVESSAQAAGIVTEGASDPLEQSYCQRVVDGRLPRAIPDAAKVPEAAALPATHQLSIGAYLSAPIRLHGGAVFGTLCCFSRTPVPSLSDSDARALEAIADLIAAGVDKSGNMRTPLLLKDV